MKLVINYRKETGEFTNTWRLNTILTNNLWVKEEIKTKKKHLGQMKIEIYEYL